MSAPIGDAKSGGDIGTLPPPQEQKTGRAKDQSQSGEAAKAADYDVDKMVRWLVQSKKYRLGVNPKYNEIFWKYIELNNRRLKEIRELESAPPPSQIRWTIDPATLTPVPYEPGASAPPAVAPIPHEPGASSPRDTTLHDDGRQTLQDDPQQLSRMCAVSLMFVSQTPKTNNLVGHLFASIGDRNSRQARDFIGC
jgi:hypothetical protein